MSLLIIGLIAAGSIVGVTLGVVPIPGVGGGEDGVEVVGQVVPPTCAQATAAAAVVERRAAGWSAWLADAIEAGEVADVRAAVGRVGAAWRAALEVAVAAGEVCRGPSTHGG